MAHVGGDRCGTCQVRLHSRWWRIAVDNFLDRFDRFVTQRLARIAGQVQLNVGGFAVGALGCATGEFVTPEVLDVLDVGWVGAQLPDQVVVVRVGFVTEGFLPLQNDHGDTAARIDVRFLEVLCPQSRRFIGWGIGRVQRDGVLLLDLLERWNGRRDHEQDEQPAQNDQYRKTSNRACHQRCDLDCVVVAHSDFNRQNVNELTSCRAVFSVLTLPSTSIRQPMLSVSP